MIDFTSQLAKYKTIEARNKAFEELSDEDKRLEIAWDSLQMLVKKKIAASYGHYWSDHFHAVKGDSKHLQKIFNSDEFFKMPKTKRETCEVCARGAMMLSQIRLGNSIDSSDSEKACGRTSNLKGFSIESMGNMEDEFEQSEFNHPFIPNSDEKLANICCNVLINGDFNPYDKKKYIKVVKK